MFFEYKFHHHRCDQVILGYGRVRSAHQMYISFSWETEDAFVVELRQPSPCRRDEIGLGMGSSEGASWEGRKMAA